MRGASSKLLSHIRKPHPRILLSLSTRDIAGPSPLKPHLKSWPASQSLLFSTSSSKNNPFIRFQRVPSPNPVDPLAQSAPQISSRQKKIKGKSELEEAFESAESLNEMLAAFKEMETCFEEKDLAMACLKIGLKLADEDGDPQKTLSFARRALKVFDESDDDSSKKMSLPIAMTLHLLGSSSFHLSKFNESLGYLSRANRVLGKLEGDKSFPPDQVLPVKHVVHLRLFNVKTAMGRKEEAILDLKKALEIKERLVDDEDSRELGDANRSVAEAYVAVLNFNEALPFCLKALEIHKTHLGQNSVEVAHDRRILGVIYTGMDEHSKALEQNQLSRKVLKKWGRSADLLRAEIDAANMQIALGRYGEAIDTLKGIVQQTEADSEERAMVFTAMAKALCNQEKFADTKKCLEVACAILEKKERKSPLAVVEAYMEITTEYEVMNEFETAVKLLKKALSMLEKLPEEQQSAGTVSARIGWLLLLTGKVEEAILYLEDAAERLKESFGSKHFAVGYVYNNLGAAYMELDRPQSAAQIFMYAKEVMDASLGPDHVDSIDALQNLSKAYAAMRSYPLALDFQEKAIEGWRGHGPSAEDELNEAIRVLEELKQKASNLVSDTLLSAMPPLDEDEDGSVEYEDIDSSVEDSEDEDSCVEYEIIETSVENSDNEDGSGENSEDEDSSVEYEIIETSVENSDNKDGSGENSEDEDGSVETSEDEARDSSVKNYEDQDGSVENSHSARSPTRR